jgi:hypothetical protein
VTQIELKTSRTKKYSDFICELCNNDLEGFVEFKNDAVLKQKTLYEVVDGVKERPKRKKAEVRYVEESEEIPFIKVEPKEEDFEIQIRECSVLIEPMIKTEVFDVMEGLPAFPEHFYESDNNEEFNDDQSDGESELIN